MESSSGVKSPPEVNNQKEIKFYGVRGKKYGCFSNFSPHPILVDGKRYPTSEHFYQALKFEGTPYQELIRTGSKRAADAAEMGRRRHLPLRKDWEQVKDEIMMKALRAKFTQHDDLREVLLGTGSAELIEDSPIDYYWGIGKDGTGKNMLGKQLMKLRDELRREIRDDKHEEKKSAQKPKRKMVTVAYDSEDSSKVRMVPVRRVQDIPDDAW